VEVLLEEFFSAMKEAARSRRGRQLVFLGTGASGGTSESGRSHRLESSLLLKDHHSVLIDVTRNFSAQSLLVDRIDYLLITHGHRDASGGIAQLHAWWKKRSQAPIVVLAHGQTIAVLQERHKRLEHCQFVSVEAGYPMTLDEWEVTPLEVVHARTSRFPTFCWKIRSARDTLVYASDIASITPTFADFCQGTRILIIDGAMWKRRLFSHISIDRELPGICQWAVERILLTQIGRTAPPHEQFQEAVRRLCPRASPAYDGMCMWF
jgi:phosphoribosyl 1,2-cyclic phosphodiesterase